MQSTLEWVPAAEFGRVLAGVGDRAARCAAFAALSRINTLYMIKRAGSGHLGSSFSAADVVAVLLLDEMTDPFAAEGDVYFSSKGHDAPGLYSALIGLGMLPEPDLHRLRRLGGLPGHPDVHTPHMAFNTGSLGMGISKAKGMILANRLRGARQRVFVLTGDGELQEGQNWEALAGAARAGMRELTVVVDHNKIQSDTWVRDVSDLGDLTAKFEAFGWGVLRCDGHDHGRLAAAFRERGTRYPDRPVVIIADTVKGGGCPTFAATNMPAGEWRYRFHSGAPADEDYRSAHRELVESAQDVLTAAGLGDLRLETAEVVLPVKATGDRLPEVYGRALAARAAEDDRIVALDADLVLDTGLIPFSREFPGRFFECGIAEQDMVSMAAGLAARGLRPFVHSFSCFLHSRPNEQIYTNATEGRGIVYVGSLAGLAPAGPGHSHQSVREISALGGIPGLTMLEPVNAAEVVEAVEFCARSAGSSYLRLVSVPVAPEVAALPAEPLVAGRGRVVRPGTAPLVVLGAGPVVLAELLKAADLLAAEGIAPTVVNLPWLNTIDEDWLADLLTGVTHVVLVENHYTRGGQADVFARALAERHETSPVLFHGIGLTEVPRCGTDAEALAAHRLDAPHLAEAILRELRGRPVPGESALARSGS